jgi:hypothetical protein
MMRKNTVHDESSGLRAPSCRLLTEITPNHKSAAHATTIHNLTKPRLMFLDSIIDLCGRQKRFAVFSNSRTKVSPCARQPRPLHSGNQVGQLTGIWRARLASRLSRVGIRLQRKKHPTGFDTLLRRRFGIVGEKAQRFEQVPAPPHAALVVTGGLFHVLKVLREATSTKFPRVEMLPLFPQRLPLASSDRNLSQSWFLVMKSTIRPNSSFWHP